MNINKQFSQHVNLCLSDQILLAMPLTSAVCNQRRRGKFVWLKLAKVHLPQFINQITQQLVQELLNKHRNLFRKELGTLTEVEAMISVPQDSQP